MKRVLDKTLFFRLAIAFAFAAVAGTLLHECGHYLAARMLGYRATISYASTHWENDTASSSFLQDAYAQYGRQIMLKEPYPLEQKVKFLQNKNHQSSLWITLAGPLQTMLTGCIGLLLLFINRKKYSVAKTLTPWQWVPVFLSLFWMRQLFNCLVGLGVSSLKATPHLTSDETKLAIYYHWPVWSISTVTACIALLVSLFIIFKIVPTEKRWTFLVAGIIGSLSGFLIWVKLIGPVLLPYPA